jgi:hypothetical protein
LTGREVELNQDKDQPFDTPLEALGAFGGGKGATDS